MDTDQTSTEQTCGRTDKNGKKYAQHHIQRQKDQHLGQGEDKSHRYNQHCKKNEMVLGRAYQPPQRRPMDLACHQLETIKWQEKTTRETSQAMERRPGQILERHDMAEESTRQGSLETACWGLRPTTGHNGCLMMMMMMEASNVVATQPNLPQDIATDRSPEPAIRPAHLPTPVASYASAPDASYARAVKAVTTSVADCRTLVVEDSSGPEWQTVQARRMTAVTKPNNVARQRAPQQPSQ